MKGTRIISNSLAESGMFFLPFRCQQFEQRARDGDRLSLSQKKWSTKFRDKKTAASGEEVRRGRQYRATGNCRTERYTKPKT
jgi:hypothetical protein